MQPLFLSSNLAAVYAAAVTAILIGAGALFLFILVHRYDALIGQEQPT
jgi:hypothetical protein